jgi:hypothetical protein
MSMLLCLALQAPLSLAPSSAPAPHHLVRLTGARGATAAALLDLDVAERSPFGGPFGGPVGAPAGAAADGAVPWVDVIVTDDELARLARLGVPNERRITDLEAHYRSRLSQPGYARGFGTAAWLQPPFAMGSMGGYYSLAEVESVLDQMANAYPHLVAPRTSLGATLEGRQVWMVKLSDHPLVDEPEPEVRIDAMHHAREPQGMQATLYFMSWLLENYGADPLATYVLNERELFFVPCVNPDGYEYNRATNPAAAASGARTGATTAAARSAST